MIQPRGRKKVAPEARPTTPQHHLEEKKKSLQDKIPSKMIASPKETRRAHFTKEFANTPSKRDMSRKMSSQIQSMVPPDVENVVVDWSNGVVETNVGDAKSSFVDKVIRNGKESERVRQQANDILGKFFSPPNGYPLDIAQRLHNKRVRYEVKQNQMATDDFGKRKIGQEKPTERHLESLHPK